MKGGGMWRLLVAGNDQELERKMAKGN